MFATDDVVNLVAQTAGSLVDEAVFAASASPLDDDAANGVADVTRHFVRSGAPVLSPSGEYAPDP